MAQYLKSFSGKTIQVSWEALLKKYFAEQIVCKFSDILDISISVNDINNPYTIENKKQSLLKVEFVSNRKKQLVLRNSLNLRETKICIAQDLATEEKRDENILVEHQKITRIK